MHEPYSPGVIELRQYTVHAGRRDEFIELFEREFIESQEAVGMQIIGMFRDLDDPQRVVWLRGFANMAARADGLSAFYGSAHWKQHRPAANATMLDSDNVLLLAPSTPASGFASNEQPGIIVATISYVDAAMLPAFAQFFERSILPVVQAAGARVFGCYQSEFAPNTFPALPVRDASVFVCFASFRDVAAFEHYQENIRAAADWREHAPSELLPQFARKPEVVRLQPTNRSRLH
jgi:quinol monooxygenase YgiN